MSDFDFERYKIAEIVQRKRRRRRERIKAILAVLSLITCIGLLAAGAIGPERITSAYNDARGGLRPGQR